MMGRKNTSRGMDMAIDWTDAGPDVGSSTDARKVVTGYQVGKKICDILGVNPRNCSHITIEIPVNGIVTVHFKCSISEEELIQACHVIKESSQTIKVKPDTVVGEHRG